MILLLSVASLVLDGYLTAKIRPGINFIKLTVFSVCGFFSLYTVVSGLFFWADAFSFTGVLSVCVLIQAVLSAVLAARDLRSQPPQKGVWQAVRPEVTFYMGSYWIPLLIAVLALPFTWNKFELYSMGQDQGTYQVKALALMAYDTHNYMEMKEFTKLETDGERQKYLDFIYEQNNLYLPRVEAETETDASRFETITGTIHGLPTYSALLGLWGMIFGYAAMIGVQTPLYLCIIFLTYFICENLHFRKNTAAFVTVMTAASPIVVWLSKSSLTEIGILMLICEFLYFLTAEKRHGLCMVPIIVFAFFHISLYAFMPIFVIVLAVMYLRRRDRGFLAAAAGSVTGYAVGAIWAFMIAPYYSYGNYSELGRITGGILGEKVLIPLIVGIWAAITLLCLVLCVRKAEAALFRQVQRIARHRKMLAGLSVFLMRLFLVLSLLFFVYKGIVRGETTTACEYLQISTYIYMSGIFMVPLIYLALFFRPRMVLKNETFVSLTLLFLYCVVMYSMVMRVRILFYYYFARYAALFLPVIFLTGAVVLEQMDRRAAAFLSALMLLTFVPYDKGLAVQKDHTRCEWEFLDDVCEYIGAEDAFVVGPEEQQIVYIFPVKLLTGCDVYYADERLDEQLAALSGRYEHVYYMDYDTVFEDTYGGSAVLRENRVSKVYTNWNHLSYLDYFNITNPLTPIPLNYVEYRLKLSLYEIAGR